MNERTVIFEYVSAYFEFPRIPGNVPSRVIVTRSHQRHRLNAGGGNRQPTVCLVRLARLCCLSGVVGRLLLSLILATTPFGAVTHIASTYYQVVELRHLHNLAPELTRIAKKCVS